MTRTRNVGVLALVIVSMMGLALGAGAFFSGKVSAQADEVLLPQEVFQVGNKVHGLGATYSIEEAHGGWIKVRPYRCLDDHPAEPHVARWIYVPAVPTPWSLAPEE